MTIETNCSGCGKKLAVGDEHAGKRARCPSCGQIYTIPFPGGVSAFPQAAHSGSPDPASEATADKDFSYLDSYDTDQGESRDERSGEPEQYWMRAVDGSVYGPVDRETLNRWFVEGRVGVGYQIRQGAHGSWTTAEAFRATASTSAGSSTYSPNPYSPGSGVYAYPKADQGVLILAMGIMGFIICPVFSLVAWIMGGNALKDIQAGQVDPTNKGLVQAGYYLGMINCILCMLCFGGYFLFFALALVLG